MIGLASHLVHVRDRRHLLVRRAGTPYRPGFLSCIAGRIEPGECPRAALVREVAEEVGLRLDPEALVFRAVVHNRVGASVWVSFFFEALSLPGAPVVRELEKIAEIDYYDLDAVGGEVVPYVLAALTRGEPYLELSEPAVAS